MSRILIDLPDAQVEELAVLVETEQRPRAAVIRDAIEAYIAQHRRARGADVFVSRIRTASETVSPMLSSAGGPTFSGCGKARKLTVWNTNRNFAQNGKGAL